MKTAHDTITTKGTTTRKPSKRGEKRSSDKTRKAFKMRPFALVSLFISAALATPNITALLSEIPECALSCVMKGPGQVGCDVLDLECQCGKLENMTAIVAPCMVHANCTLDEIMSASFPPKVKGREDRDSFLLICSLCEYRNGHRSRPAMRS